MDSERESAQRLIKYSYTAENGTAGSRFDEEASRLYREQMASSSGATRGLSGLTERHAVEGNSDQRQSMGDSLRRLENRAEALAHYLTSARAAEIGKERCDHEVVVDVNALHDELDVFQHRLREMIDIPAPSPEEGDDDLQHVNGWLDDIEAQVKGLGQRVGKVEIVTDEGDEVEAGYEAADEKAKAA